MFGIAVFFAFVLGVALMGVILEKRRKGSWVLALKEVFSSFVFWGMFFFGVGVFFLYLALG